MKSREFVKYAKRYAVDDSVKIVMGELTSPRTLHKTEFKSEWFDRQQQIRKKQSEWFTNLDEEGQKNISQLLHECSELTLLNLFALIDGVGGDYKGVFEILAVDETDRTLVNPQNTEMLHDLFSETCEEDRTY